MGYIQLNITSVKHCVPPPHKNVEGRVCVIECPVYLRGDVVDVAAVDPSRSVAVEGVVRFKSVRVASAVLAVVVLPDSEGRHAEHALRVSLVNGIVYAFYYLVDVVASPVGYVVKVRAVFFVFLRVVELCKLSVVAVYGIGIEIVVENYAVNVVF